MAVFRGKKRPESTSASALPHHGTKQQPNNNNGAAKHQSKPLLRPGGGGIGASSSNADNRRSARIRATIMLVFVLVVAIGSVCLSYGVFMESMKQQEKSLQLSSEQHQHMPPKAQTNESAKGSDKVDTPSSGGINHDKCAFRSYPSNRLYGLSSKTQSKFLSEAAYIRGQWPIIINPNQNDNSISNVGDNIEQTAPVKVCLDTTSWEDLIDKDGKERLPFTDGHNPSVISLAPNPYSVSDSNTNQQHVRLDPRHLKAVASAFPSDYSLDSLFLSVSIFGGGQCKFGFSPEQVDEYRFSLQDEPQGGKRAIIAVLAPPSSNPDSPSNLRPFQTLAQTTLLLERDATYGTGRKRAIHPEKTDTGFARMHQEFDDPRLFFHLGRVWVLYRNGPLFGYNDQIHNPVHFEEVSSSGEDASDAKFVAYVKASETVRVSGGRNIALISEEPVVGSGNGGAVEWVSNPTLKALTWVDPITVRDDIKTADVEAKLKNRRLLEVGSGSDIEHNDNTMAEVVVSDIAEVDSPHYHSVPQHRRLGSKPSKSNIHGTNGYMVPLPSTGELLGIAHFHRPENRKSSEHALHGHHYTHAFFTIARQGEGDKKDAERPFKLKRLSNEFVFRANSVPAGETQPPIDGDIIQFASGLDVVGKDVDGTLIISYGINDCEGGVFTLAMQSVQKMLMQVGPGQEVVDLMEYVKI